MEPESATGSCVRCERAAAAQCDLCREAICDTHIEHGRASAHNVFGPMLFRSISVACNICYRERFWLAVRGGLACMVVVIGLVSVIERTWTAAIGGFAAFTFWWLLAGYFLRLARSERRPRA
ncbi:MAG TPA: hypothetical protein VML75_03145 [Kofleriaceae bacterium]|nr:hypothetical protein [Kofleriaceae bacterium]